MKSTLISLASKELGSSSFWISIWDGHLCSVSVHKQFVNEIVSPVGQHADRFYSTASFFKLPEDDTTELSAAIYNIFPHQLCSDNRSKKAVME